MYSFGYVVRLRNNKDVDRVLPRVFRSALRYPIAIIAPARAGGLFFIATIHTHYFQKVEAWEPGRIVGVYEFRGDRDALLEALMEDMRYATRLA